MKNYHLVLNDVDDFIPQLAKKFSTEFSEKLGEYSLDVPNDLGEGNIHGINFPNGIGLYTYTGRFNDDIEIVLSYPEINPLRFIYCMSGSFTSYLRSSNDLYSIHKHEYLVAAPSKGQHQTINLNKDEDFVICYLEIDRRKFQQYLSFNLNELEPIFYKIFSDISAKNSIQTKGKFSLKVGDIIRELQTCETTGFPRVNYLGAKALEVMSYMLSRFEKEDDNDLSITLKDKDREGIEKAVAHINKNIAKAGTVNELSRIAGMNNNKLQDGFQTIYGKTVNEYIRDIRLTKALDMLSTGRKNVSEVVYELGLSSRSYFSKIFKNKYGISPRYVMKNKIPSSFK